MSLLYRQCYFAFFQLLALIILCLSCVWIFEYLGGLTKGDTDYFWLLNWHQICMITAFAILYSNAVTVYRLVQTDLSTQHRANATLLVGSGLLVLAGLVFTITWKITYAESDSDETLISAENFYTFHSWAGVVTAIALATTLILRLFYLEEHPQLVVVLTVFTLGAAYIAMITGIEDIVWYRNKAGDLSYSSRDSESYVVNFLVLFLFIQVGAILWVWYRMQYSATDREEYADIEGKDNTHIPRPMVGVNI